MVIGPEECKNIGQGNYVKRVKLTENGASTYSMNLLFFLIPLSFGIVLVYEIEIINTFLTLKA
jgi:hypothetical protein